MQNGLERVEGFLLCTHCEGEGFCRADGGEGGCALCREGHSVVDPESQAGSPLVTCGVCGGMGYFGKPSHIIGESEADDHPPLGWVRIFTAFIMAGIIAMVTAILIIWAVQAKDKNSIKCGSINEAMRFDSYITVHQNRTMTVEEVVILKNNQPKEFVVERVYPAFKESFLKHNKAKIGLNALYLDGQPLKFHMSIKGNTFTIRAPQKTITPGIHTYAFIYHMPLPIPQSQKEPAIQWVVDGSSWGFPAKQATVVVALPPYIDRQSVDVAGGVGPAFWFKRDCISTMDDSGNIIFCAGQPLAKSDQLDFKVVW